jgi:hypothetical protein
MLHSETSRGAKPPDTSKSSHGRTISLGQHNYQRKLGALTAVVNSAGSAACLRCWPIGDNGVFRVGMLFVVKRRCRCPRASLLAEDIWDPTVRRGLAREANDDSSRGDLRAPRSPMPVEKAILLEIHCTQEYQRLPGLAF